MKLKRWVLAIDIDDSIDMLKQVSVGCPLGLSVRPRRQDKPRSKTKGRHNRRQARNRRARESSRGAGSRPEAGARGDALTSTRGQGEEGGVLQKPPNQGELLTF